MRELSTAMVLHPLVVPVNKCIANKIGSLSEKMMKAKVISFLQSEFCLIASSSSY